jgi:eukaryotic-like serine/threonine-protein kinase
MPETRWKRVESLFHEALRLSPEQREEFLTQSCQDDPLLYQEIASLLSHYRSEDELLEKMGVPPVGPEPTAPTFNPGDSMGGHEIIRLLGKGGMGEVYLARDSRLGRKVAIKILPRATTRVTAVMERLRREAQAASALNHPNILTIYDFEQQDDIQYMVTEFVEGASLRESIGKLSTAEALNYARQIGEALKAAHAAGIVHRDIKPENIMVRSDGYIKVLDFGLAKLTQPQVESGRSLFQRLADSEAATVPGLLVGTINYMPPEQVRGQTVDQRTDVWSWGVVLYEMLTGRRPFESPTPGDTLAAILSRAPEEPSKNAELNRIVAKALSKDVQQRYPTMNDALQDLVRVRPDAGPERFKGLIDKYVKGEVAAKGRKLVAWVAAVALILGTATYWAYKKFTATTPQVAHAPIRVEVTPLTTSVDVQQAAISPDEQMIAYTTQESSGQQTLWVRQNGVNPGIKPLGNEKGRYLGLTFSPDGRFLYYVVQQGQSGQLYRLRLPNGLSQILHDDVGSAISFSPDGARYAFLRQHSGKSQIIVAGVELSSEETLWAGTKPDSAGYPVWSPDGCCVLFSLLYSSGLEPANIRLVSVNVNTRQHQETVSQPWYYTGRPVWLNDGRILISATRNDANAPQLWEISWPGGSISPVLPNKFENLDSGKNQREIVTVEREHRATPWIISLDRPLRVRPIPDLQGTFYGVAWTKSGHLISQSSIGGEPDFFDIDPGTGKARAITHDRWVKESPAVSPDGRYLVYDSNRDGTFQLWRSGLDDSHPTRLTTDTSIEKQASITPDGKWIIYTSSRSGGYALWKVSIKGGRPEQVTTRTAMNPSVSSDGTLILCRYDDPKHEWSTAILDATTGKPVQILPEVSTREAAAPKWSADGKSILYTRTKNGVSNVWARPLHGGSSRQLTLFTTEEIFNFAPSADGRSLACIRGSESRNAVLLRIAQ